VIEKLHLHLPQRHKATKQDSTLRVEMNCLEEQADNVKTSVLFCKPLSWWTIRPTIIKDTFDPALWETFLTTASGLEVLVLSSLSSPPCHNNGPLAKCCCKKRCMDFHDDHTSSSLWP
jgi:hypothetical protein